MLRIAAIIAALLTAGSAWAGSCESDGLKTGAGTGVARPQVLGALREAVLASGLGIKVTLCRLPLPSINATVDSVADGFIIGVSTGAVRNLDYAELRAVFGHEVAHIALGHRSPVMAQSNRNLEQEGAADALSAKWFGKAPMRSALRKILANTRTIASADIRRAARIELPPRINALN